MASITITIPDDKVAALVQAIEHSHAREDGETDLELAKRCLQSHLQKHYVKYKAKMAKASAAVDAADDITLT